MYSLATHEVHPAHGLAETLSHMAKLEKLTLKEKSFIDWTADKFYSACPGCLPGDVWKYMRNNFNYKVDAPFDELIIAPYVMKDLKEGDCDDFSLFAKSCIDIVGGWFTNYILFARERNEYTHIAVLAHRGKYGRNFRDAVLIDGTNPNFDIFNRAYKYYKIIKNKDQQT